MNLEEIREQIDEIDAQILELFCRRMDLVKQVAEYKIENGLPVLHPGREQKILDRVRLDGGEAYGDYAAAVFQRMMEVSRQMQEKVIEAKQKEPQKAVSKGEEAREAEKSEEAKKQVR